MSKFYSGSVTYSENVNKLLLDGYKNNLLDRFFGSLPSIALVLLLIFVSYSLYVTYQGTLHDLKVSKHYINAKKDAVSLITLRHIAFCTAAFAVPLIYWCYLLAVWFPYLIKYPLRYILGHSITPLVLSSIGVMVLLCVLTQFGLVMSRLSLKLFNNVLKG